MKILLVHGIGGSDRDPNYYYPWKTAIKEGLKGGGLVEEPRFVEFHYDDLFAKHSAHPGVYAAALVELLGSAAVHAVTDPIGNFVHGIFHPGSRDLAAIGDNVRWYAGMVAQFTVEDGLRKELRDRLLDTLDNEEPELVAAHSLGSLLTFDFLHNDSRSQRHRGLTYLSFGSQINNPFVRSRLWPGRMMMPDVNYWYHLFNPQDRLLVADIALPNVSNFRSVETPSTAGHSAYTRNSAPGYLDHPNTQKYVWRVLAQPAEVSRAFQRTLKIAERPVATPTRRALLIGIDQYPNPEDRLEGCVNDVFLFSSLLQERGFNPEDIRVVLNERATANGIRERLQWLLEDAGDGMERVLFYSGHGAQLPGYNAAEVIDHMDECLVPHDFNWTKETAITDDDFYHLYCDLPFSAKFFAVFDCCHSGGMTREGGHKVRGLTPPDDIRHRMLRWDLVEQMWKERKWDSKDLLNEDYGGTEEERREMMGHNGITYRLGRSMRLRECLSKADSHRLAKKKQALYMPVIIQACAERQLSYEYRHGVVSYGAFTFAMAKTLRANAGITFDNLVKRTAMTLKNLHYPQDPQLVAPTAVKNTAVPGDRIAPPRPGPGRKRKK